VKNLSVLHAKDLSKAVYMILQKVPVASGDDQMVNLQAISSPMKLVPYAYSMICPYAKGDLGVKEIRVYRRKARSASSFCSVVITFYVLAMCSPLSGKLLLHQTLL
jgi:hypothetical protein